MPYKGASRDAHAQGLGYFVVLEKLEYFRSQLIKQGKDLSEGFQEEKHLFKSLEVIPSEYFDIVRLIFLFYFDRRMTFKPSRR